jgi:Ni/Co efflux regulator RcnB
MKSLICVVLAGVLLGGTPFAVGDAEAGERKHWKHRGGHDRDRRHDRDDRHRGGRYFSDREVYLVREYYGPRYVREPRGPRYRYYRSGYLPRGWHRRVRPYPVYIEREVVVLPHGHRRGIIDGHAVVYNSRGLIIDVAVLF